MEFTPTAACQILQATPHGLRAWLSNLSEPWVRNNYGEATFSPFDVVGHLIHGERTDWIPRARMILEHGETKPFEPFDRYAMYEASKGKSIGELLDEFASLRQENLEHLDSMRLTDHDWARTGMHPALGRVTLRQLIATWAVHDLNHIAQIAKAMAYQYREQVGPWEAYLSILKK